MIADELCDKCYDENRSKSNGKENVRPKAKRQDTMLGNQKQNKDHRYHRIHTETKVEMGRSFRKTRGQ